MIIGEIPPLQPCKDSSTVRPRPSFLCCRMAGHWIALKPEVETRIVFIFSITQKKYFSKSGALDILETFLFYV